MNEGGAIGRIACIGWGSLVWRPESLPIHGDWLQGGPTLPVEFARQSEGKRMTLVLCPGRSRVFTRWAVLDVPDVHSARRALAVREWDRALRNPAWIEENIGFWDRGTGDSHGMEAESIVSWATGKGLTGVVWTSLPCKFNGAIGRMPSEDEVVDSLRSLEGNERALAEQYVRNTPQEVDTPYRRRIARDFGWI